MKKQLFVFAAALGLSTVAMAQETETYKPVQGSQSLEVTFDPGAIFGSNGGNIFALPGLGDANALNQGVKYRTFKKSELLAYRVTALVGFNTFNQSTETQNASGDDVELKTKQSEWAIQLRPGFEKHFTGTKRLSPYVGLEAILGFGANSLAIDELSTVNGDDIETITVKNDAANSADFLPGFTFGAGALAGFDYYVAKDLYLGLEVNYAFTFTQIGKVKTESTYDGVDDTEISGPSFMSFAPRATAQFKLGWNF